MQRPNIVRASNMPIKCQWNRHPLRSGICYTHLVNRQTGHQHQRTGESYYWPFTAHKLASNEMSISTAFYDQYNELSDSEFAYNVQLHSSSTDRTPNKPDPIQIRGTSLLGILPKSQTSVLLTVTAAEPFWSSMNQISSQWPHKWAADESVFLSKETPCRLITVTTLSASARNYFDWFANYSHKNDDEPSKK